MSPLTSAYLVQSTKVTGQESEMTAVSHGAKQLHHCFDSLTVFRQQALDSIVYHHLNTVNLQNP